MSTLNLAIDYMRIVIKGQLGHMESTNDKLTLLTEIFCITEDIRHEICWNQSGEHMEKGQSELVRTAEERETIQGDTGISEPVS